MGVALERRPLVDRLGLGDDPVRPHLAPFRHLGADDDEIVELKELIVVEDDPELAGRGVLGAQHPPDGVRVWMRLGHPGAPTSLDRMTAERSSR